MSFLIGAVIGLVVGIVGTFIYIAHKFEFKM